MSLCSTTQQGGTNNNTNQSNLTPLVLRPTVLAQHTKLSCANSGRPPRPKRHMIGEGEWGKRLSFHHKTFSFPFQRFHWVFWSPLLTNTLFKSLASMSARDIIAKALSLRPSTELPRPSAQSTRKWCEDLGMATYLFDTSKGPGIHHFRPPKGPSLPCALPRVTGVVR